MIFGNGHRTTIAVHDNLMAFNDDVGLTKF